MMKYNTTIKTRTITKQIETVHIHKIDWDYDFYRAAESMYPNDKERKGVKAIIERLKQCENGIGKVQITTDGGWPRCGWGEVLNVGMVSQWPYWTPRPCVLMTSTLGGSAWEDWTSISDIRPLKLN